MVIGRLEEITPYEKLHSPTETPGDAESRLVLGWQGIWGVSIAPPAKSGHTCGAVNSDHTSNAAVCEWKFRDCGDILSSGGGMSITTKLLLRDLGCCVAALLSLWLVAVVVLA